MSETSTATPVNIPIEQIAQAVRENNCQEAARLLKPLNPPEIAHVADSLQAADRPRLLK